MDLLDTLRSTGAVRGFTDEPVGDDTVVSILDTARFAPSGGNKQPVSYTHLTLPTIYPV